MELWERLAIVVAVIAASAIVAKLVDLRIARKDLPPQAVTRYRVLRRSLMTVIITIGVLSALLVVPQVRAIAGGLLASSAVVGIVVGLAAQRPLANFVAGLVIAFTQPLRHRRSRHGRRRRGHGRGDRAQLHVHPHRFQRPARDSQ